MSLAHALLGLLSYGPAAGYDLRTAFDPSVYVFWQATLPQIYRTLRRLEGEGWLASTIEPQEGRPSRRVYHLTPSGRQELIRWLAERPPLPESRNPLAVKLFFGSAAPPGVLKVHVQAWRAHYAELLRRHQEEYLRTIEAASGQPGAEREAPFWRMSLEFGRREAAMMVEWCDAVLAALEDQKTGDDQEGKAASTSPRG